MDITNREIATLIWLLVGLGIAVWKLKPGKTLIKHLLRPLVSRQILTLIGLMACYIATCVWALANLGLWGWSNLKTTLVWAFGFAFVMVAQIDRVKNKQPFFRKALNESIGMSAVIAFLASSYEFSLPAELILVLAVLLLTLLAAFSEQDKKLSQVNRSATNILLIVGVIAIGNSIYHIAIDFNGFATTHMARELISPGLLTLLLLPSLYALHLYLVYENAFFRLNYSIKNPIVRQHAARSLITAFNVDVDGLQKWLRHIALFHPDSKSDVNAAIAEIKKVRRRERRPYRVPPSTGWPPDRARTFLAGLGLEANDYHRTYDGWQASSSHLTLGKSVIDNNIVYYIYGQEFAVMQLKLVLNVNDPDTAECALDQFESISSILVSKAVRGMNDLEETVPLTANKDPVLVLGKEIRLTREEWVGGIDGGYDLELTINAIPSANA